MTNDRPALTRILAAPSANGGGYILGQLVNLLTQVLLFRYLGKDVFGPIGLAQIYILSLVFIGEIGFPTYFIRAASERTDWLREWLVASLARLVVLGLGTALLIAYWAYDHGTATPDFSFLLFAAPGVICTAFNPAPLLLGQRKTFAASIALPLQWVSYAALILLSLSFAPDAYVGMALGLSFSLSLIIQALVLLRFVAWPAVAPVSPGTYEAMLGKSMWIWLSSLAGTFHALLLAYALEALRPDLLAWFVILNQILTGLRGVNNQVQRAVMPLFVLNDEHSHNVFVTLHRLWAWGAISGLALAVSGFYFVAYFIADGDLRSGADIFPLIIAEWMLSAIGTLLVTRLFAEHQEKEILWIMMITSALSIAVQIAFVQIEADLVPLLYVRVLCVAAQLYFFHKRLKLIPPPALLFPILAFLVPGLVLVQGQALLWAGGIFALIALTAMAAFFFRRDVPAKRI